MTSALSPALRPRVIVGTAAFGNLYAEHTDEEIASVLRAWFEALPRPLIIDSAGKYGAGLALQRIGAALRDMKIPPHEVLISNKLAWYRVPLKGDQPTFEPGVWHGLQFDAQQRLGRDGILACWQQGNELLGLPYHSAWASVHDPDEYLAAATDADDRQRRWDDILQAYSALNELKERGQIAAIGIGAKDWRAIQEISQHIQLDWVMLANSLTIMRHPQALLDFVAEIHAAGTWVINSAVFHGGFLLGGDYLDYAWVDPASASGKRYLTWRQSLWELCQQHQVSRFAACAQYALQVPGVDSLALATARADRIKDNAKSLAEVIPSAFWREAQSLLDSSPDSST